MTQINGTDCVLVILLTANPQITTLIPNYLLIIIINSHAIQDQRLLSKLSRCRDEENSTKHTATNTCTDHTEEMPMAMMLVDFPDTHEV